MAESNSRSRSWLFAIAFGFIIAVTIGDIVDQGSSIWDWLVIAVCTPFLLQQVSASSKSASALLS